jgi:hypothetical protein
MIYKFSPFVFIMLCCDSLQLLYGVSSPSKLSENGRKMNGDEAVLVEKIYKFIEKPVRTVVDKMQKILKIIKYKKARTTTKSMRMFYDIASFPL